MKWRRPFLYVTKQIARVSLWKETTIFCISEVITARKTNKKRQIRRVLFSLVFIFVELS